MSKNQNFADLTTIIARNRRLTNVADMVFNDYFKHLVPKIYNIIHKLIVIYSVKLLIETKCGKSIVVDAVIELLTHDKYFDVLNVCIKAHNNILGDSEPVGIVLPRYRTVLMPAIDLMFGKSFDNAGKFGVVWSAKSNHNKINMRNNRSKKQSTHNNEIIIDKTEYYIIQ